MEMIMEEIKEKVMEEVIKKYGDEIGRKNIAIKGLLEELINSIMKVEREIYLGNDEGNKGNGYYNRRLGSGMFNLELEVPRDRKGEFRPKILPKAYKRVDKGYIDLLMSLVINGYSESQLVRSLKELGLPYSEIEMEKIKESLIEKLKDFKSREIDEDVFALFIDAYHCEIRDMGKVKKGVVYSVVGINLEGKKDVYGFYSFFGNENRIDWLNVFNDLIERGLRRVCIIVSDDFKGIGEVIKSLFPNTEHQLCYVHLERNVRRNMKKEDAKGFNKELERIKGSIDFDEARNELERLCSRFKERYPGFIKNLETKIENYIVFTRYPEEIRKYIYTTNAVENINSKIELMRHKLGGYFQSVEILEINYLLEIERLKQGRWKNPIPHIKGNLYEIKQIFNLKFYHQTQNP